LIFLGKRKLALCFKIFEVVGIQSVR
jgi:hypothetical protein